MSVDFEDLADDVHAFLAAQGVTGVSYLKTGTDNDFVNAVHPDWSGAVPATFLYDQAGTLRTFWEGDTNYEDLATRVEAQLAAL